MSPRAADPGAMVGTEVVHRCYVSATHAHYAGNLVDGAWGLGLFGDVATEMCIRTDGDEGLFASYDDVQFRAPVRAGDVVEAVARLVRVGRRSRRMEFELRVVARGLTAAEDGAGGPVGPVGSRSRFLEEPVVATTASGTVVVP
ncbi:MAG: 3-aminobutyryl-CoA ammonia-lyase [Marmoricola sp.]|nr:3-aminobutyryl-CoA ammonia-lyase [Marmoricola sp.]